MAGGTSFASPIWAGIQALVNQYTGVAAGQQPNPALYKIAATEYGPTGISLLCNASNGSGNGNGVAPFMT